MKISKYARLGILIIISSSILFWGLSYLKGNDIFKQNDYYNVVYERIDGLVESNKVTLNGYQIGHVKEITLSPDNSGKLVVTFAVDASFKIPINSVAQIISSDIMGTRSIKMILSSEKEIYHSKDTIPGAIEKDLKEQVSLQVLPIKNKAEQLLGTIDSAITVLTVIFNEDARHNLSESFKNINQTITNIEQTTAQLQQIVSSEKESVKHIISNMDDITTAFKNNSESFREIMQNLSSFSDTLSQFSISPVLGNISKASLQILAMLEQINSNESTAGLLLNDDELYKSINNLSDNLGSLINDIQTNPKRYLHFSAFNLGKEVYINASSDVSSKNIIFKVHLISTEKKILSNTSRFNGLGEIEEYKASSAFTYLAGGTHSYSEIMELYTKAKKSFNDATIVAFKNGRLIKFEKALNSLRK